MKTALYRYLENLGACNEALKWIDENSINDPQVAWDTCSDVSWLVWIAYKHLYEPGWSTHKELVLAACDCVETVLHLIPDNECRPKRAFETVRSWAAGNATITDCLKASSVADVYYPLSYRLAAQSAVHVAGSVSYTHREILFFARYDVSESVIRAAQAIDHSGGDFKKALADMAGIVRERLHLGEIEL